MLTTLAKCAPRHDPGSHIAALDASPETAFHDYRPLPLCPILILPATPRNSPWSGGRGAQSRGHRRRPGSCASASLWTRRIRDTR